MSNCQALHGRTTGVCSLLHVLQGDFELPVKRALQGYVQAKPPYVDRGMCCCRRT